MGDVVMWYAISVGISWVVLNVVAYAKGKRDKDSILTSVMNSLVWPWGLWVMFKGGESGE